MLLHLALVLVCLHVSSGGAGLLGAGAAGGAGGAGGGGTLLPAGSTVSIDAADPRMTRVAGSALLVDVDLLKLRGAGGTFIYTPTHTEFAHGTGTSNRWSFSVVGEGTELAVHHNNIPVLQMRAHPSGASFVVRGSASFASVLLDQADAGVVAGNLCTLRRLVDKSASQGQKCESIVAS